MSQEWWRKERVDNRSITQIVADISLSQMNVVIWGDVLLSGERASNGGDVRDATQLDNQS